MVDLSSKRGGQSHQQGEVDRGRLQDHTPTMEGSGETSNRVLLHLLGIMAAEREGRSRLAKVGGMLQTSIISMVIKDQVGRILENLRIITIEMKDAVIIAITAHIVEGRLRIVDHHLLANPLALSSRRTNAVGTATAKKKKNTMPQTHTIVIFLTMVKQNITDKNERMTDLIQDKENNRRITIDVIKGSL